MDLSKWQRMREKVSQWHKENPPDDLIYIDDPAKLPKGYCVEPMTLRLTSPDGTTSNIKVVWGEKGMLEKEMWDFGKILTTTPTTT